MLLLLLLLLFSYGTTCRFGMAHFPRQERMVKKLNSAKNIFSPAPSPFDSRFLHDSVHRWLVDSASVFWQLRFFGLHLSHSPLFLSIFRSFVVCSNKTVRRRRRRPSLQAKQLRISWFSSPSYSDQLKLAVFISVETQDCQEIWAGHHTHIICYLV